MLTYQKLVSIYLERHVSPAAKPATQSKLEQVMALVGARRDVAGLSDASFNLARQTMLEQRSHKVGGGKKAKRVHRPYSPFTIDSRLRACRAMFNWAVTEGLIEKSPMAKFKFRKLPQPQPKAVSADTFAALVQAAETHEHYPSESWMTARDVALLYTLRDTGARCGGLVGARVDDLDLKRGRLLVTEKGDKSRYVYLSPVTVEKVRAWLLVRGRLLGRGAEGALFISRDGYAHMRPCAIGLLLRRLAKRAGIHARVNPHSFRHAFARDLLRAGADLSRVSQLMGHTTVQVTVDYYARWADHELQATHKSYSPLAGGAANGTD